MTVLEHITLDSDDGSDVLELVDDEGSKFRFRLSVDARVDLRRIGQQVEPYLVGMEDARASRHLAVLSPLEQDGLATVIDLGRKRARERS